MTEKFDDIMDVVGGDQSVTYVCFIQDHSGSMGGTLDGPIGGGITKLKTKADFQKDNYNEQMTVLRRETGDMETLVTLIEFDDKVKPPVFENVPCDEAKDLGDYWLGGMTALYDAIGKGIQIVREKMDEDQRENKAALVIIQTDGMENASEEFSRVQLLDDIKILEETKLWTFVFLGENIDEELTSNMSAGNITAMANTVADYTLNANKLSDGLGKYYTMRKRGVTYSENIMSDAEENKIWQSIGGFAKEEHDGKGIQGEVNKTEKT
jgi:hypothetical protein